MPKPPVPNPRRSVAARKPPPRPVIAVRTPAVRAAGRTGIDWPRVRERLTQYAKLARMHRPVGALLLLWPTWWALWLATGDFPSIGLLIIFTLGVWLMRSAVR